MLEKIKWDKASIEILANKPETQKSTEVEIIKKALAEPINSKRLGDIVKSGGKIIIVVSDITRSFQKMSFYMPYIIEEILNTGIKKESIEFLVALGTHRESTIEDLKILFGDLYGQYKVNDSATETSSYDFLGITSFGTPVEINKIATDADYLILTGAIVHHDMAGFGGGRKSVLPGIATEKTITANHSLAMADNMGDGIRENIAAGVLENNSIHLDMVEAVKMIEPCFIFNVIQNEDGNIINAVAGHWHDAHIQGCNIVNEKNKIVVHEQRDVLWANSGGFPKDINLYQTSKALSQGQEVVRDGGDFILIADCSEGLGADVMEYMFKNFKDNSEREAHLRKAFTIGKFAAYLVTLVSARVDLTIVSKYLKEEDVENTGIRIVRSIDEAKDMLEKKYPSGYTGYYTEAVSSLLSVRPN